MGDNNTYLLIAYCQPGSALTAFFAYIILFNPTTTTVLGDVDNCCSFIDEKNETQKDKSKSFKITQLDHKQWNRAHTLDLRVIPCSLLCSPQGGKGGITFFEQRCRRCDWYLIGADTQSLALLIIQAYPGKRVVIP